MKQAVQMGGTVHVGTPMAPGHLFGHIRMGGCVADGVWIDHRGRNVAMGDSGESEGEGEAMRTWKFEAAKPLHGTRHRYFVSTGLKEGFGGTTW